MRLLRRIHEDESGVSLLLLAAGMVAFLGIAAIVIDVGMAMSQGRLDQNAADFAALAAANDAYLGITDLEAAAQSMTDDNLGESVPLTGCELTAPGSPFSPISDCLSVAPYGLDNPEEATEGNWVGQTWVAVPDQVSGPFFGPSIETRREAAAAILPRGGGPLAPMAVGSLGAALACLDPDNPLVNDDCTTPLSLIDSRRCTPSIGDPFVTNLDEGIDHLISRYDGIVGDDRLCPPTSNQLQPLGADWLQTLEDRIENGFLAGGGPGGLDSGLNGLCDVGGNVSDVANCIATSLSTPVPTRFFYAPVVSGTVPLTVTDFAGLYLGGVGWITVEGLSGSLGPILDDLELFISYDPAVHNTTELRCKIMPGSGLFAVLGPWNGDCDQLRDEIWDAGIIEIPLGEWLTIWDDYISFVLRADLLQVTAYVIPALALPEDLRGPGPDVNPYEVDGLTQ